MAELSPHAQEVILCEECEESPAQHHCLTCAGHLCGPCKDAHGRKKIFRSHKIVQLTADLPVYGNCVDHSQCKYEVFCKNCDVPICMECIMKEHNGHKIEEMQKVYERKKQFILREISKLENDLIPKEEKDLESTKNETTEMKQATERMRKDMVDQCEKLITHIRKLLKESLVVVDNIEHSKLEDLRSQMQKSEEKISKYKDIKADLERKSTIRIVTDFLNSTKHMSAIPPHDTAKTSYTLPNFAPAVVENLTINHHFGLVIPPIIRDVRKKISPNLHKVKEIHTKFKKTMCDLQCIDDSTVWVISEGSKVVMQHNEENKNVNRTLFCSSKPWGLYIDGNCAFYSDYENKQITRIISTDWNPSGLHICKSGDILVCLINKIPGKGNAKVVKYTGNGNVIFETTQDNKFHRPLYIAENINLDVCVSDSFLKKIIVLNSTGNLKFQYDGILKGLYRSFSPRELVTDSLGNIIVADESNKYLHVISKDGDFLLHLETSSFSTILSRPCGLSIDPKGML